GSGRVIAFARAVGLAVHVVADAVPFDVRVYVVRVGPGVRAVEDVAVGCLEADVVASAHEVPDGTLEGHDGIVAGHGAGAVFHDAEAAGGAVVRRDVVQNGDAVLDPDADAIGGRGAGQVGGGAAEEISRHAVGQGLVGVPKAETAVVFHRHAIGEGRLGLDVKAGVLVVDRDTAIEGNVGIGCGGVVLDHKAVAIEVTSLVVHAVIIGEAVLKGDVVVRNRALVDDKTVGVALGIVPPNGITQAQVGQAAAEGHVVATGLEA